MIGEPIPIRDYRRLSSTKPEALPSFIDDGVFTLFAKVGGRAYIKKGTDPKSSPKTGDVVIAIPHESVRFRHDQFVDWVADGHSLCFRANGYQMVDNEEYFSTQVDDVTLRGFDLLVIHFGKRP